MAPHQAEAHQTGPRAALAAGPQSARPVTGKAQGSSDDSSRVGVIGNRRGRRADRPALEPRAARPVARVGRAVYLVPTPDGAAAAEQRLSNARGGARARAEGRGARARPRART